MLSELLSGLLLLSYRTAGVEASSKLLKDEGRVLI